MRLIILAFCAIFLSGCDGDATVPDADAGAKSCVVPVTHATIQDALTDARCAVVYLTAGLYPERVTIARDVTVTALGAGEAILDGSLGGTVVTVRTGTVTLSGFVIQNGSASRGGGVAQLGGTLTLVDMVIRDNYATVGDAVGGGVYATGGPLVVDQTVVTNNHASMGGGISAGKLSLIDSMVSGNDVGGAGDAAGVAVDEATVLRSTIAGNTGGYGVVASPSTQFTLDHSTVSGNDGGVAVYPVGAALVIVDSSTISGNVARYAIRGSNGTIVLGGGLLAGGSNGASWSLYIASSTITGNAAVGAGAGGGGIGLVDAVGSPATVRVKNSIVAGNFAPQGADCRPNAVTITSAGYNMFGDCSLVGAVGDQMVTPALGPLADNGGRTKTHALPVGSLAIDAGDPAGCTDKDGKPIETDQRGMRRVSGVRCDVGAYER